MWLCRLVIFLTKAWANLTSYLICFIQKKVDISCLPFLKRSSFFHISETWERNYAAKKINPKFTLVIKHEMELKLVFLHFPLQGLFLFSPVPALNYLGVDCRWNWEERKRERKNSKQEPHYVSFFFWWRACGGVLENTGSPMPSRWVRTLTWLVPGPYATDGGQWNGAWLVLLLVLAACSMACITSPGTQGLPNSLAVCVCACVCTHAHVWGLESGAKTNASLSQARNFSAYCLLAWKQSAGSCQSSPLGIGKLVGAFRRPVVRMSNSLCSS